MYMLRNNDRKMDNMNENDVETTLVNNLVILLIQKANLQRKNNSLCLMIKVFLVSG